jgi:hypothetical protein
MSGHSGRLWVTAIGDAVATLSLTSLPFRSWTAIRSLPALHLELKKRSVRPAQRHQFRNRNYLARYELRLVEEQQATDLAQLRQLERKYRTQVGEPDLEPRIGAPPVDQTPVTPVQGSLF